MATPSIEFDVTEDIWERAKEASSGGCLVADALKETYPKLSHITVDMATIRATDRKRGERYTWLTPASAQELLLAFDQGWAQPEQQHIKGRRPVKVVPVRKTKVGTAKRHERLAELEGKEAAGETLTGQEQASLRKLREHPDRPSASGKATVSNHRDQPTVVGGRDMPRPKPAQHANLLAGLDRHFGARRAKPAKAFEDLVESEVARRIAERSGEVVPREAAS